MATADKHMTDTAKYFSSMLDKLIYESDDEELSHMRMIEISEKLGVSSGALSLYINGKREPKISTLVSIAKGLGVSPNTLLDCGKLEDSDTFLFDMCAYTGLSEKAAKILHKYIDMPLLIPIINFIIETIPEESFTNDLISLFTSQLWDDIKLDFRYNTLPGTANPKASEKGVSSAQLARKESLLNLMDDLESLIKRFHDQVMCKDSTTKYDILTDFALSNVDIKKIFMILYPGDLMQSWITENTFEFTEQFFITAERDLEKREVAHNPELKDDCDVLPVTYAPYSTYKNTVAYPMKEEPSQREISHHRSQALLFLVEYIRRCQSKDATSKKSQK